MQLQEDLKYIRIPFLDTLKIESPQQNLSIIGLIDASGSMEICWEWLANFWNKSIPKENLKTITFSNQPKMRNNTNLEP